MQGDLEAAAQGASQLPDCEDALPQDAGATAAGAEVEQDQANELAQGLYLAEEPLQPPHLVDMGWREGQRFSDLDDPDRMREPWAMPSFMRSKDPVRQRAKTSTEDLDIRRVNGAAGASFAKVVHGVLDEQDCAELLACVNRKGFTPALLNIGGGSQVLAPDERDGHRVIVDCPSLTDWLLEVLRPHLPQVHYAADLIDLNERCRFLCYTPGQYFAPHCDGRYSRPRGHPHGGDFSKITLQVYLHDVPAENGGGTTFLTSRMKPVVACQPGAGDVLIFTQDLLHEGSVVTQGLKYTLRTEAMYRRQDLRG